MSLWCWNLGLGYDGLVILDCDKFNTYLADVRCQSQTIAVEQAIRGHNKIAQEIPALCRPVLQEDLLRRGEVLQAIRMGLHRHTQKDGKLRVYPLSLKDL